MLRRTLRHLAWFHHGIFRDPLPDFTKPDLPKEKPEK